MVDHSWCHSACLASKWPLATVFFSNFCSVRFELLSEHYFLLINLIQFMRFKGYHFFLLRPIYWSNCQKYENSSFNVSLASKHSISHWVLLVGVLYYSEYNERFDFEHFSLFYQKTECIFEFLTFKSMRIVFFFSLR